MMRGLANAGIMLVAIVWSLVVGNVVAGLERGNQSDVYCWSRFDCDGRSVVAGQALGSK